MHRMCSFKRKLLTFLWSGKFPILPLWVVCSPHFWLQPPQKFRVMSLYMQSSHCVLFDSLFCQRPRKFRDTANAVFNMYINSDCFLTVLCLCLRFRVKKKQFSANDDWLIQNAVLRILESPYKLWNFFIKFPGPGKFWKMSLDRESLLKFTVLESSWKYASQSIDWSPNVTA